MPLGGGGFLSLSGLNSRGGLMGERVPLDGEGASRSEAGDFFGDERFGDSRGVSHANARLLMRDA